MSHKNNTVCELCCEQLNEDQAVIRIAADATGHNDYIMVFATFHTECVHATMGDDDCDEVDFIVQARAMVSYAQAETVRAYHESAALTQDAVAYADASLN